MTQNDKKNTKTTKLQRQKTYFKLTRSDLSTKLLDTYNNFKSRNDSIILMLNRCLREKMYLLECTFSIYLTG